MTIPDPQGWRLSDEEIFEARLHGPFGDSKGEGKSVAAAQYAKLARGVVEWLRSKKTSISLGGTGRSNPVVLLGVGYSDDMADELAALLGVEKS